MSLEQNSLDLIKNATKIAIGQKSYVFSKKKNQHTEAKIF